MDEIGPVIISMLLGAFITGMLMVMFHGDGLNQCRHDYNVYACEYVAVPVKPEE